MKRMKAAVGLAVVLLCAVIFSAPVRARADGAAASGDLNADGRLSAADAALLLRSYPVGKVAMDTQPDCDLTGNGALSGNDARAMLLFAVGGISDLADFRERISTGLCSERLFNRFCYIGTRSDPNGGYHSKNVSVTISSGETEDSRYFLADVYVQDLSCLVTAFAGDAFRGASTTVQNMFDSIDDGIVAMNGDYYSIHVYGPVIRNGVVYAGHVTRNWDIAVLLDSGELAIYPYRKLTKDALAGMDVYQTWVFGPSLLDETGHAKTKFRSAVQPANPRSVLGYYEPGHYAFLVVDGRTKDSKGLTMEQLSQLCEDLGFARAYNLDGGRSSILLSQTGFINEPYKGGRTTSDIIAIRDLPQTEQQTTETE
ncbi:MAG: phosphodiester glycosidase family protein [Eubacteriales bacterium]|nr:phosphodiester glycosidase family protein [Eubacteriales bacterium]